MKNHLNSSHSISVSSISDDDDDGDDDDDDDDDDDGDDDDDDDYILRIKPRVPGIELLSSDLLDTL